MAFLPQDRVEANDTRTALCVTAIPDGVGDFSAMFPEYVAVSGDAQEKAALLAYQQATTLRRKYLMRAGIVLAILVFILVLFMIQNNDFTLSHYITPWLYFIFVITVMAPSLFTAGNISPDGIIINQVVYRNLTPADRDSLFQAYTESADIYEAALAILTQRYLQQEKDRAEMILCENNKRDALATTKATIILNNTFEKDS